jgi:hypothetical protein
LFRKFQKRINATDECGKKRKMEDTPFGRAVDGWLASPRPVARFSEGEKAEGTIKAAVESLSIPGTAIQARSPLAAGPSIAATHSARAPQEHTREETEPETPHIRKRTKRDRKSGSYLRNLYNTSNPTTNTAQLPNAPISIFSQGTPPPTPTPSNLNKQAPKQTPMTFFATPAAHQAAILSIASKRKFNAAQVPITSTTPIKKEPIQPSSFPTPDLWFGARSGRVAEEQDSDAEM